jgi:branched-chain amino acid transport system substrate-binding protein
MGCVRSISQFAICLAMGNCVAQALEPDSANEIVLGMSTVLTGPAENLGKQMQKGVWVGLEHSNRAGGVRGRKFRLIVLDDGYEPSRTAPNVRQLIEKDDVLAIIGDVGTPTATAAIPIANEQKTLFFASFSGGGILRKNPPDRYVINFRASYAEETAGMIDALVEVGGLKPEEIAFFTQRDSYGNAGYDGGIAALKNHGLKEEKDVLNVGYERNTLAVEDAVATLLVAEHLPRAVIMVGAYAPCGKFIKLCLEGGLRALFLNVSFVGSSSLAHELGKTDAPVIVTQVVPYPLDENVSIVRDYQTDLRAVDPSALPGFGGLEGYIAARILELALDKIEERLTREAVVDALEKLGQFDIGLGEPLNLSSNEHQASHRIWPTILKDGSFVPFQWDDIGHLLKNEAQQ